MKEATVKNYIARTNKLVSQKLNQITIPNISSSVARALLLSVDSVLAAKFIGVSALAAVALASPFMAIDEMLHCLMGLGVTAEVSQTVGRGDRIKANRIIATVIISVFVLYVLIFLPTLFFPRKIMGLFSNDQQLIEDAVKYIVPMVIAMPFFEMMLCLERAYQIDGRPALFAARPVITTIMNIFLDILFVAFLHMDVTGLALASILSTLIGYILSLSHGLSEKCTIHPDFSVLKNPKECLGYLKANAVRGGSAAIDEGMYSVVSGTMCKALSACGGVQALAIYNIFNVIKQFVNSFILGLNHSTSLFGNILFGKEDYSGLKFMLKRGLTIASIIGVFGSFSAFFGSETIGKLYSLEGDALTSCITLMKIISPAFLLFSLCSYVDSCFLIINKFRYSYFFSIAQQIVALIFTIIGANFGLNGVFIGYCISFPIVLLCILIVYIKDNNKILPLGDSKVIAEYSIPLEPSTIVQTSMELQREMNINGFNNKLCNNISLLIEECSNLIRSKNENKSVIEDIQVCSKGDRLIICIMDNGIPFNSIFSFQNLNDFVNLEKKIIVELTDESSYDRVLELNFVVLKIAQKDL